MGGEVIGMHHAGIAGNLVPQHLRSLFQMIQRLLFHHSAELGQLLDSFHHRLAHARLQVFKKVRLRHAHPHPVDLADQSCGIIGHRQFGCGRIVWIITGNHIHHQGGIPHIFGERTGVVQRPGQGKHPMPADAAVGGFEADNAIEDGGNADRSPRVRPQRAKTHVCGHGSARPAARSACDVVPVPGIAHRTVVGIHDRPASKLIQI